MPHKHENCYYILVLRKCSKFISKFFLQQKPASHEESHMIGPSLVAFQFQENFKFWQKFSCKIFKFQVISFGVFEL